MTKPVLAICEQQRFRSACTGSDQPAQLRSLISTFVVHYLDNTIPILAKSEISRL